MYSVAATCFVLISVARVIGGQESNGELKPTFESRGILSAPGKIQELYLVAEWGLEAADSANVSGFIAVGPDELIESDQAYRFNGDTKRLRGGGKRFRIGTRDNRQQFRIATRENRQRIRIATRENRQQFRIVTRENRQRFRTATRENRPRIRIATRENRQQFRIATRENRQRFRTATRENRPRIRIATRENRQQFRIATRENRQRFRTATRENRQRIRIATRENRQQPRITTRENRQQSRIASRENRQQFRFATQENKQQSRIATRENRQQFRFATRESKQQSRIATRENRQQFRIANGENASRRRVRWNTQGYSERRLWVTGGAPQVCENFEQTDENGAVWGKFVCPLGDLPEDHIYCCGPEGKQTCCRFFDDPKRAIGGAAMLAAALGTICLVLFGLYKCLPKQGNKADKKKEE